MTKSVSGDSSASVGFNVPFPSDYSQLLEQVSGFFFISDMYLALFLSLFGGEIQMGYVFIVCLIQF